MIGDIIQAIDQIERLTKMSIENFIKGLSNRKIVIISVEEYNGLKYKK